MILPDVNVLVHAAIKDDPLNARAIEWLGLIQESPETLAIADVVFSGVVRVGSRPGLYGKSAAAEQIIDFLNALIEQNQARVVSSGRRYREFFARAVKQVEARGNLVSDAHLVALAAEHGCRIATRDKDFKRFSMVESFDPFG